VLNSWLILSLPFGQGRLIGSDASAGWDNLSATGTSVFDCLGERSALSVSSGLETFAAGVDSLANYSGSRNIGAISRKTAKFIGSRKARPVLLRCQRPAKPARPVGILL